MENNEEKVSIKDVSVKWGLILGVISIALFIIGVVTETSQESWSQWLGLIPTIIIFVLAHKQFKEEGDGFMSFGEGTKIGLFVTIISSVISTLFFYIYISFVDNTFVEKIREQSLTDMQERGMSDEQIEQAMGMTETFTSPAMLAVFGILAAVFFGFILALIVTAFTKNSNPDLEV